MPWISLGTFPILNEWRFTASIEAEIFRIKHVEVLNPNRQYLKAVIAQAFFDEGEINVFEPKRLTYREEKEIFTFYFPGGINSHVLGFKRLDKSNIDWIIEAEVFLSSNAQEDFANYLLSRFGTTFGELMSLYSRGSGIVPQEPNSVRAELAASESKKILDSNARRRNLKIINGSNTVLIFGGAEVNNIPQKVIITLLPNEVFDLPTNNGLYMGEVWIKNLTANPATVGLTEFNAPQ